VRYCTCEYKSDRVAKNKPIIYGFGKDRVQTKNVNHIKEYITEEKKESYGIIYINLWNIMK
jgi:hypothetical protein